MDGTRSLQNEWRCSASAIAASVAAVNPHLLSTPDASWLLESLPTNSLQTFLARRPRTMGLGALQPGHLIVVLVIVLLIFGPGKLPELGKAVGDGLRELKRSTADEDPSRDSARLATTATITPIS